MKISEVMTRGVELTNPDATLQEVAKVMAEEDVGFLPVGDHDRMIGMITDRDIAVRAVAKGRDPKKTKVRDVMTERVLYCFEDEDADKAAESMSRERIRRLPIVDRNKRLVGVVSLGDIARKHNPTKAGATLSSVCHVAA
ncbi:MAG TPA: CBS domain-containing protein [Rhizomicrobium sp.]|jgi:CBS domain-containing protein|nr:CBS domain-containing protein [Rhizomicrobium sp.]